MVSRTWGKTPSSKQIACTIALEKAGVIRPVADQIKSGLTLTEKAFHSFKTMADAGEDGAAKVIKIAEELRERGKTIKEYRASQAAGGTAAGQPAAAGA